MEGARQPQDHVSSAVRKQRGVAILTLLLQHVQVCGASPERVKRAESARERCGRGGGVLGEMMLAQEGTWDGEKVAAVRGGGSGAKNCCGLGARRELDREVEGISGSMRSMGKEHRAKSGADCRQVGTPQTALGSQQPFG